MSSPLQPRFFSDAGSHWHPKRKSVPEGSDDFQRVLDDILLPGGGDDKAKAKGGAQVDVTDDFYYHFSNFHEIGDGDEDENDEQECETDDEDDDDDSESRPSLDVIGTICVNSYDSNNNFLNRRSKCSCEPDVDYHARAFFDLGGALSPSQILVTHCNGHCVSYADGPSGGAASPILKLPDIHQTATTDTRFGLRNPGATRTMGTSCSSNHFDSRDWHDVGGTGGAESGRKHRGRQGRRSKKLQELHSREHSREAASPQCTCRGNSGDAESDGKTKDGEVGGRVDGGHAGGGQNQCVQKVPPHAKVHEPPPGKGSIATLSPSDAWHHQGGTFFTPGKLSPEINSTGHVKVVRVPGSGKARATAALDVSPHRLLSRRTVSTSSDKTGTSDSVHAKTESTETRPRSQSWSNGKLGGVKAPPIKPVTSFLGSPILASLNNSKSELPLIRQGGTTTLKTGKSTGSSSPARPITAKFHESTCPLYSKTKTSTKKQQQLHGYSESVSKTTDSLNHVTDVDDFSPITRRRAASESHTTRPKRTLPRTPGISGSSEFHEHAHVHWADEEKGSSLSTSVFLTSIRPRSSSHTGTPHRPILKKVAGL